MKLYKFRSLGDCQSFERALEILDTGKFWCSRFWEMNDPMEGIYSIDDNENYPSVEQTFKDKSNKLICSFSGTEAITWPLMWGYYCDGFKGVAIEIEVDDGLATPVKYTDALVKPEGNNPAQVVNVILNNKLSCWIHENEYRFLVDGEERKQTVGKIVSVIIGRPYPKGLENPDVDNRHAQIKDYQRRVKAVINVAAGKGITLKEARFKEGKIAFKRLNHKRTK